MKRSDSSRQRPRAVCVIPPGSELFHTEQGGVFRTLRKCLGWWHLSPHVLHFFLVGCIVNVSYPWLWTFHTHFSRFIPGLASGVLLGPPSHVPVQDDRVLFTVACLLHCEWSSTVSHSWLWTFQTYVLCFIQGCACRLLWGRLARVFALTL